MGRGRGIKLQKKLKSCSQRSHLSRGTELTPPKFQLGSQEESQHPSDCVQRCSECFQTKADTAGGQNTQRAGGLRPAG